MKAAPYVRPPEVQALLDERKRTMLDFTDDHRMMVTYAIYREDLEMDPGKMGSQCGHAFDLLLKQVEQVDADLVKRYRGTGNGTKVLMYAKNERQLMRAYTEAVEAGIHRFVVIDRGTVKLPHFTGEPVITAIGIGPLFVDEANFITKRLSVAR